MTDGTKPKRAARRRRTTRRLSRKPIRVPVDEVPRAAADEVEVEVDFDELSRSSRPPTRDFMDEDLEQDGDGLPLVSDGPAPSYDDDELPADRDADEGPAVEAAGLPAQDDGADDETGHAREDGSEDEDDGDGEVEEERVTDPDIAVEVDAGVTADSESAETAIDEVTTNPRIELTPEMVAAAGRVSTALPQPSAAQDEQEADATTDPRIEVDAIGREPAKAAPQDPPSVVVAPARFISEPPPPRRSSAPPPPDADDGPTAPASSEEEDSLDEIEFEVGLSLPPPDDDAAHVGVASIPAVSKPPPPPPNSKQRSKRPPPPPSASRAPAAQQDAGASRVPVKQARGWWMDLFSDEYLQTVRQPTDPQIERQCDFIVATLGLQPGSAVLDVGCGLGKHALELARRGCLVVGLDMSLSMITGAAEVAKAQGLQVNFLHADMRDMEFDGTFDAVLCLGTSFGFFDDDSNTDMMRRLHRALRPGGRLLLDVVNRDFVIASQPNLVWFEGVGCVCMEESDFNYFSSRLFVKRTVMHEDGRQTENEYSLRLYSLHELGQLMQHRGFKVIEVSGLEATRGIFFGNSSPRLIILGERRLHDGD